MSMRSNSPGPPGGSRVSVVSFTCAGGPSRCGYRLVAKP
jgi:hypothetical protein